MFQHRRVRIAALAIATAVAVPAVSLIATTSAQAGGGDDYTKGQVVARTLPVRKYPTTYGKAVATLENGTSLKLWCKVEAVEVDDNRIWYNVLGGGWVAARYVKNVGKAPQECGGRWWDWGHVTKKPSVNLRQGPTNKSKLAGTAKYDKTVEIICQRTGPKVDGNPNWYQLEDGRWVTARYIKWDEYWKPSVCDK